MITTKEKIKNVGLSIFAGNGYEAATMNEIAKGVNIRKPSLYSHFESKDELFFSIFLDLAYEYHSHLKQWTAEAGKMPEEEALFFLFEKYISYFTENPEKSSFWNRVLFFTPSRLHDEIYETIHNIESEFQENLRALLDIGMKQGTIKSGNTDDLIMSFRSLRSGVLAFLQLNTGLTREKVRTIWEHYWFGIKAKAGEG